MRVLFLSSYSPYAPSTRYRITQFLPHLRQAGIACNLFTLMDQEFFDRFYEPRGVVAKGAYLMVRSLRMFREVTRRGDYDVAFIQREALVFGPPLVEWLVARGLRKPLVFDLDDAIFLSYVSPFYGRVAKLLKFPSKVSAIMRLSAHVIVGNAFTERFAREYNVRVTVVPTVVDAEQFWPTRRPDRAVPVIGWLGSRSAARYLRMLVPVFEELACRYHFVLKIVGAEEPFTVKGVHVENLPFDRAREVVDFQGMDIGVYPLADEPWAWGKPGLKLIQYMAVGVPFVASPVGGNLEIVRDGECGFFARTEEEWVDRLARLLEERALRQRLGDRGRDLVERRYCVQVQAKVLADILNSVCQLCV